ncbi:DUF3667 domain-containing protein [Flavobacterium sp. H122]|uniref:DUF3667 domain-containing protein n=1 Tax=Flavobacterium sp. H122 TaxID=2529860 RepID=UPI0010AA00BC|nr:DUF3667 domain-containing protein [Flavobacterium sp. H122]
MGKFKLRTDMTCLNCGQVVDKRFCPNCGQENKEPKESFHYLFFHTIEDLVHYDSGFWKTILFLLFYPAKLTKEYLAGKRKMYVVPVKLYIFISFITFFILSILPTSKISENELMKFTKTENGQKKKINSISEIKAITGYSSLAEYDSIQKTLPEYKKSSGFQKYIEKHLIKTSSENTPKEFMQKFLSSVFKNIPKTLFIIMPLFALILWLFHNKKKWYYFDHGIFTLHYFSMILLSFTIFSVLDWFLGLFKESADFSSLLNLLTFILICWWLFYFYRSHSRMYGERKYISRIKATLILLINLILISSVWIIMLFYLALNVN